MEKKNRRGRRGPDKIQVFKVQKDMPLFEFLLETFADRSKTTVKSYLAHRQIAVNNTPTTKFDAPLHAGDEVTINFTRGYKEFRHPRLRIVYEDEFLIVVDKGYGLLSMSTDRIKANTAYHILSDYVRRDNPANRIFILHRLDRDTSGLMMFAKSQGIQEKMQRSWNDMVLATNGRYSLVELQLATGRKNQIRVHMQDLGHSIAGDRKYGAVSNPLGRLSLHASRLRFVHPVTRRDMLFETPVPAGFQRVVR